MTTDTLPKAASRKVTIGSSEITLGPTEFRLLSALMEKTGRVWSREALLDRVWGRDIYVDTRTVDVHIGRLRKVLMSNGGEDPIRTVRGAGYALDEQFTAARSQAAPARARLSAGA